MDTQTSTKEETTIKKVYIAGAYSGESMEEVEKNVRRAEAAAWLYYLKGHAVFCPHVQTHSIHMRYNIDNIVTYTDWLTADIAWLEICDVAAFIPGWEESKGAKMEYIIANALGKEIEIINEIELEAVMASATN